MISLKQTLALNFILLYCLLGPVIMGQEIQSEQQSQQKFIEAEGHQDPQAMLKEMQKYISPEDMAQLQAAIESGDQERVQEIINKVNLKLTTNGEGLDAVLELSLRSFREQSAQSLRAQLEERFTGSFFAPLFKKFPKLLDFAVNMLQDPVAVKKLSSIIKDRTRLIIFLVINILLFIGKKIHQRKNKEMGSFTRWTIFASLRVAVLISFFHEELWPTFLVFKRTFF